MRFSIVVVCLNPGKKLAETIESIQSQTYKDYEIVVKDGLSSDGALQQWKEKNGQGVNGRTDDRIRIYEQKDRGIYDAMNQAVKYCRGDYILFLNCGDLFYGETVLAQVADEIDRNVGRKSASQEDANAGGGPCIFYGNIYEKLTGSLVSSNPHMDAFACYRNVPCHQCCFYDRRLFEERGYDTKYRVRADYEHFLWSFFVKKAETVFLPVTVASYEGGGFSETAENRKVSAEEHREITRRYMSAGQVFQYRMLLLLTLAPLRTKMAQSRRMSGIYNKLKRLLYH
ncbi:MAG: glycosyltransferase [Lachnospiraceae bacterium]|nr:glycosyltransferase [Lachnospiraceae bacterium]